MYRPNHYDVKDKNRIIEFIRAHSFGILVSFDGNQSLATHLPVEALGQTPDNLTLIAHISRANPQWESLANGQEAMVIFQGPHTYISSKWYESHNVPTWNYKAAHVYGVPSLINGQQLLDHLKRMVTGYEKPSPNPLSWEEMPEEMIHKQLRGIIGLEIKVTRMEASFKLSQNRNQKDFENIIKNLRSRPDAESHAVAYEMEALIIQLF